MILPLRKFEIMICLKYFAINLKKINLIIEPHPRLPDLFNGVFIDAIPIFIISVGNVQFAQW